MPNSAAPGPLPARLLGGLLLLVAMYAAAAGTAQLYIGEFAVDDQRTSAAHGQSLGYRIASGRPAALQAALGSRIENVSIEPGAVTLRLDAYPAPLQAPPDGHYTDSSFLVDYSEPAVQRLRVAITREYGERPSPAELETFVYHYIEHKNGANGFDVASRVATSRAGDCTEHAVLLTALLRLYGYPARIVLGLYVGLEARAAAFGHAWSEYFAADHWVALDATQIGDTVGPQYIPLGSVETEGPGYVLGMVKTMQLMDIDRISVD